MLPTLPADDWPTVVAMLELTATEWPECLAVHDLDYLRHQAAARTSRQPGRRFLAERWRWTAHRTRAFLDKLPTLGWVYFAQVGTDGLVKIGFSRDPGRRLRQLGPEVSGPLFMLRIEPGSMASEAEYHRAHAADRVVGEWFRPTAAVMAAARPVSVARPSGFLPTDGEPTLPAISGEVSARPVSVVRPVCSGATPTATADNPDDARSAARSGTGEPGESPDSRPVRARSAPDPAIVSPPHTPPNLSSTLPTDLKDRLEGEEGEPPPLPFMPPVLTERCQELPEARVFLRVWTRWRNHPKAPARWSGGPADALAWFLELLGSDPTSSMGKDLAALDVVAALESWDSWLSDRADAHGKPGTKGRARFPKGWKNNLRTWFSNQVKFGRNLRQKGPTQRRGAWAGRATDFTPPPTTGRPCEPPDPPGDPDALERF